MIKLKDILNEWSETHTGPKRWFKPYGDKYTQWEKHTNHTNIEHKTKPLTEDGYPGDPIHVLEKGLKQITGHPVSVSVRNGKEYRAKWAYAKVELQNSVWDRALDFIEDQGGRIDTSKSDNYYEANWEREEPAEAVPTIYFTLR